MAPADDWSRGALMSGKGDKRRPSSVSKEQFDENWERIFGGKYSSEPMPDIDWTQAYDYGAPTRDGSHFTDEDRERLRELMPTDLWAFPKNEKPEVPDVDWTQCDGSHITDENWERAINRSTIQNDWNKPIDEGVNLLREVNYDNMWQHSCTVEMGVMWIGKDETCNYCGAWEEDEE